MSSVLDPSYAGLVGNHRGKTFDRELLLLDAMVNPGNVQSTTLYIGSGLIDCDLVIDVMEKTGTGIVTVVPEYSATEDFTAVVKDRAILLPAAGLGQGIFPIRNSKENELPGVYMRLNITIDVADTTTSAVLFAFLAKK